MMMTPRFHRALLFITILATIVVCYLNSISLSLLKNSPAIQEEGHTPNTFIYTIQTSHANQKHISFRLHSPQIINEPSQFLSVPGYTCPIAPLPPAVHHTAIFNFTTTVSTDLKLLFVGDSIMQQFAQNFYSSVLLHETSDTKGRRQDYIWNGKDTRHVILRSFINSKIPKVSGLHVCSSISAPVHGGGAVGYYRLLDLPNQDGEKDYVYCKNEKGWSMADVRELVDHEMKEYKLGTVRPLVRSNSTHDNASTTWYKSQQIIGGTANTVSERIGKFHAIILRPPGPGWMKLHEITRARILESIQLLHKLFHVETVILSTLMFNNNVLNTQDWRDMLAINDMIRDIARTWDGSASGVKFVLVQDLASFTNEILWMNARHLGYNVTSSWEQKGSEFLLHRLEMKSWKFNPSISMVCNTPPICEPPRAITLPNGTVVSVDNLCVMNLTADTSQCFFNRFSR